MIYESKKNEGVKAKLVNSDEKYGTCEMVYVSGPDEGKTFSITNSTLKRWWSKSVEDILGLDYDEINTPYPEPKEKKYIPKPEAVIEYEAKKMKKYNADLPTQDDMVEQFGEILSKVNKTYIVFKHGEWLERKSGYINLYTTEDLIEPLSNLGLTVRKNGMKNCKLSIVCKIETIEEYNSISDILTNL